MNISENPFGLNSSEYLLDVDYLNSTEYQKELEKHLNELDDVLIKNENASSNNQRNKKVTKKKNSKKDKKVTKKENKEDIEKIEEIKPKDNENIDEDIKGGNESASTTLNTEDKKEIDLEKVSSGIDKLSKKIEDFKHKSFRYIPSANDMNFINSLSNNGYLEVEYMQSEKDGDDMSNKYQELNKKARIKPDNQISYVSTSYYKLTNNNSDDNEIIPLSEKKNVDFVAEIKNIMEPSASYLSYRTSKAELVSEYPNLIDPINYFIQHGGDHSTSEFNDLLAKFGETFAMLYKYQKLITYVAKKDLLKLSDLRVNNSKVKENFNVTKLPKELIYIIRHLVYYFKEIKESLNYDDKTGFYYITHNKTNYPVVCKHIYMTMSGYNLIEISKECCSNSQCKYCGDSMINYYEENEEIEIPNQVLSLTYKLMENTNCSDDDAIFRLIFNIFTGVINNFVKKDDPKYEDKANAIISLYIYKILVELIKKNKVEESSRQIKSLINNITENCSIIGWDSTKIELLLNNEDLFINIDSLIRILTEEQTATLTLLENLEEVFKTSASSEIKEIEKSGKIREFNELMIIRIIDNVDFTNIKKIVDATSVFKIENSTPTEKLYSTNFNNNSIFDSIIKFYCPDNYIHEWKKDVCSKCGLKKDLSNKDEIYDKYSDKINQNYELKPSNNVSKTKTINHDKIIEVGLKEVKKEDVEKHIIDKLNISKYEYDKIISHLFEIIPYILSTIVSKCHIKEDKLNKLSTEEILRIYIYLDSVEKDSNLMEVFKYGLLTTSIFIKTKLKDQIIEDEDY